MIRLALPLLCLALLAPASASAGTLGEVAPLELDDVFSCVGFTGTPGELITKAIDGVQFVHATRTGLSLGEKVALGHGGSCDTASTRPGGAGVLVGDADGAMIVSVRDPGGQWGPPSTLRPAGRNARTSVHAAVSDRGDVLLAWKEAELGEDGEGPSRFLVARRPPGGAFGAVESLGPASTELGSIDAGISATGEAVVLTTRIEGKRAPYRTPVQVAVAPAGGAFGTPQPLGEKYWLSNADLDVAPDGRALVALTDNTSILISERPPGASFSAPAPVAAAHDAQLGLHVRLAPDGAAALAWERAVAGEAYVTTRAAGGAFTAPTRALHRASLLPEWADPFFSSVAFATADAVGTFSEPTPDGELALTADGRALLTLDDATRRIGVTPQLAVAKLDGAPVVTSTGTPSSTYADGPVPLVLDDGTAAVAWLQVDEPDLFLSSGSGQRLRMALDGGAPYVDTAPAPRVSFGAPVQRRLGADDALRVPVRCSAACVVTAELEGDVVFGISDRLRLEKAGRSVLDLDGAAFFAPARPGPVRLRVTAGAPAAIYPQTRTITVRIAHKPGVGLPRVTSLRARRVGERVRVTFRVAHPVDGVPLFVSGDDGRAFAGEPLVMRTVQMRSKRTEYHVTLPVRDGLRYVAVRTPVHVRPSAAVIVRVR